MGLLLISNGASSKRRSNSPVSQTRASARMAEAKRRIAQATAALVDDGQTLILDGGTTYSPGPGVSRTEKRLPDRRFRPDPVS